MAGESMSKSWTAPNEYLGSRKLQSEAYSEYLDNVSKAVGEAVDIGFSPWAPDTYRAVNGNTGNPYTGDNSLYLTALVATVFDEDPRFYTESQIRKAGYTVKEGETGVPGFFFQNECYRIRRNENGETMRDSDGYPIKEQVKLDKPVFRPYLLFNAQQLDGPGEYEPAVSEEMKVPDLSSLDDILFNHFTSLARALDLKNTPREELETKGIAFQEDGKVDISSYESASSAYFLAVRNALIAGQKEKDPSQNNLGLVAEIAAAIICQKHGLNPVVHVMPAGSAAYEERISDYKAAIEDSKGLPNLLKRSSGMAHYFISSNPREKAKDMKNNGIISLKKFLDGKTDDDWMPCGRASYSVTIRLPKKKEHIENPFEPAKYTVEADGSKVIVTGTKGEEWPVSLEKALSIYAKPDGTGFTAEELERGSISAVTHESPYFNLLAIRIPVETMVSVRTAWGSQIANREGIEHGDGDYLIVRKTPDGRPDTESPVGIVNGSIFRETYRTAETEAAEKPEQKDDAKAAEPEAAKKERKRARKA